MSLEIKISKNKVSYHRAMNALNKRVESLKNSQGNELLWILEHPITFTGGIRAKDEEILDKSIKIVKTNRGGKITLHNPGQKVVYFVLNLNKRKKDIRNLINQVEKIIIEFLDFFNISAHSDKDNIGIWVNNKKIAAIGIRVTNWIAYHGFSININNNLAPYSKIIPCGLDNKKVTSVKNEGKPIIKNLDLKLKEIFIKNLKNI